MILRNLGLWRLKWLWSGREVTSQGLSLASRGSEPLYLGKRKKFNLCVRRGGCDNTDGPPIDFPSRTGSSPSDTCVCGVRRTVFSLCSRESHVLQSAPCQAHRRERGGKSWNDHSVQRPSVSPATPKECNNTQHYEPS